MDEWEIRTRRVVYSAPPFIELSVEEVRLPDGRIVPDYHHVETGAFANVVAETRDGQVIMLRQYRHGIRRVALSLPGGRIEQGETAPAAARRELLEETGYVAEEWREIAAYHASCTYGFGYNHFFHARGLTRSGAPKSDDLETSEIVLLGWPSVRSALVTGQISSSGHALPLALVLLDRATGNSENES